MTAKRRYGGERERERERVQESEDEGSYAEEESVCERMTRSGVG
jgi:hypothetical protein